MPHRPEPREKHRTPSVSARSAPALQRRCACGGVTGPDGECEACKRKRLSGLLQKKSGDATHAAAETAVPATVHQTLQSPGRPLEAAVRSALEPRFNRDFSDVRIHTDSAAAKSAQDVDALAYTVGRNVVFNAGKYSPHTHSGRALLTHELTHVVQQNSAAYDPHAPLAIGSATSPLEREADNAASRTGPAQVSGRTGGEIQRAGEKSDTAKPDTGDDCSGWFRDHESLSKRAAELYVKTELGGSHGAVAKVECDIFASDGAFACTVTFADGTPIRVIAKPSEIIVGKFPLQSLTPPPDQPLCFYSFKCPGPNHDLVLTKIRCQSAEKSPPTDSRKGPNP